TGAARRHFLDLVRVYLEARHDDHVFLAVLDEYEAARIDAPDVPGSQPAIRQHHLRGLVGTLPVTLHDLRATHADLPHRAERRFGARLVADRYIGGGQWQAHRTVEVRVGPDEGIAAHHRRGFRQPPALGDLAARDLLPALGDRALQRHAAGHRGRQLREVDRLEAARV